MEQLENIHQHCWKEHHKISELVKFESDMSEASEDVALQSSKILQMFVQICPHHTNIWKSWNFVDAYSAAQR